MAGNVSVDSKAVNGGIMITKMSMEKLQNSSARLMQNYQRAGSSGWRDQKYKDLGVLVDQSVAALKRPLAELQECQDKLRILLKEIEAYESTRI